MAKSKQFKAMMDALPVKTLTDERAIHREAVHEAAKSTAVKRKVGAIIVDSLGKIAGRGHNWNLNGPDLPCEDATGNTLDTVIHAEADAIKDMQVREGSPVGPLTMYVTHEPCPGCQAAITAAGISEVKVVGEFLKFDTGKLRYDLVPPSALKALAKVLTYGAKKYKPNNWRTVEDTDRYVGAVFRHLEAWRMGEIHDEESGFTHLEHALTNLAFLIELNAKPVTTWNKPKGKGK